MPPYLSSLLVALQALAAVTHVTSSPRKCDWNGELDVAVEGWPVLVALRIPELAQAKMTLKLSDNDGEHTTLTLDQVVIDQETQKTAVLQVKLVSKMITSPLQTATHRPGTSRATLMISAHPKELQVKIMSETSSVKYSTSASVTTTHRLPVNKVSCLGTNCKTYIDLKCRYDDNTTNRNEPHQPNPTSSSMSSSTSSTSSSSTSSSNTSDKTVYYWLIYVAVSLLVVLCLLFFVWRNEREKFRTRWWRHSQTVRRMASTSMQEGGSSQADGTVNPGEWRPGTHLALSNPAFDNSGESDLDR